MPARDMAAITAALKKYLDNGNQVTAVRPLSHGHSNETYFVEGLNLVLRLPPSETPLLGPNRVHGVIKQYEILAELAGRRNGIPVPELVLLEPDSSILGDPFFLMKRLPGQAWDDWSVPDWVLAADEATRSLVSERNLELYVILHNSQPLGSLGAPLSISEELDRWKGPALEHGTEDLKQAFALLFGNAPADAAPAPCHGDAKLANVLWEDGKITGMLDWEMAFNGDPRWDLAYILQFVDGPFHKGRQGMDSPGLWQRDRIIAEWKQRTGRDADRLTWFEAACQARSSSLMGYGDWLFQTGKVSDERFGTWREAIDAAGSAALSLARLDAENDS